jgi:hypothetical protein
MIGVFHQSDTESTESVHVDSDVEIVGVKDVSINKNNNSSKSFRNNDNF